MQRESLDKATFPLFFRFSLIWKANACLVRVKNPFAKSSFPLALAALAGYFNSSPRIILVEGGILAVALHTLMEYILHDHVQQVPRSVVLSTNVAE